LRSPTRAGKSASVASERFPEETLPALGEGVDLPFGPAEERGAEGGGEREVVLGQGEEGQEREEVADGEAVLQPQAVGAGDGEAAGLERAR
jgi:hypothetical protein